MSNHIHCVIQLDRSPMILGEVVRRMKAKTTYTLKQTCWQANYYEHIVRSEEALGRIREYIINNPLAEKLKLEEAHQWACHQEIVGKLD